MKRGGCVLITQPQAMQQARGVCGGGGGGGGEGEVVEQHIRALGNPHSSFSSSSFSLCIRRGFDNKFHSRQCRTLVINVKDYLTLAPFTVVSAYL